MSHSVGGRAKFYTSSVSIDTRHLGRQCASPRNKNSWVLEAVCEVGAKTSDGRTKGEARPHIAIMGKKLLEDPELFDNVITADESWAYMYDPATKQQSKW